jgi:hypothetical protein
MVEVIEGCPFDISGPFMQEALNIIPLGLYDVMLSMDWLATNKEKLNCYEKTLECEDEEGVMQGIHKPISMTQISVLHIKKFSWEGCPSYVIHVLKSIENKELKVEEHPVL